MENLVLKSQSYEIINKEFFSLDNISKYKRSLPGYILYLLILHKRPLSIEYIIEEITPELGYLRKADGSLYSHNLKRSISSSLNCSGIFFKSNIITEYNKEINSKGNTNKNEIRYWFYEEASKELLSNHQPNLNRKVRKTEREKRNKTESNYINELPLNESNINKSNIVVKEENETAMEKKKKKRRREIEYFTEKYNICTQVVSLFKHKFRGMSRNNTKVKKMKIDFNVSIVHKI